MPGSGTAVMVTSSNNTFGVPPPKLIDFATPANCTLVRSKRQNAVALQPMAALPNRLALASSMPLPFRPE